MGIAKKVQPQAMLAIGLLVSAISTFFMGASTVIVITLILQVVGGFFYPFIQVGIQTMLMKNTEAAFMGRVGGAITPIFMGMMVVGISSSGFIKDNLSLFTVYAASGCLLVIGALLLAPLMRTRKSTVVSKL